MGKITPKLSLSLQRKFKVRQALGLSPSSRKMQGHRREHLAEVELTRRRRRLRAKQANWNSLCYELQDIILSQLSISDLSSARLAGLGGTCVANTERLRTLMQRRCQNVHGLWRMWRRATPRYVRKAERETFGPVEFTSRVHSLCLRLGAQGLPPSIGEMRELRTLDVSRGSDGMLAERPALSHVPRELQWCHNLLELRLSFHQFEQFPAPVLALRRLRRLDMEYNVELKSLPEDMGDKLVDLRFLNIRGCRKVTALPESLLRRLELFNPSGRHKSPLLLGRAGFPAGYLRKTITPDRYPKLAEALRKKLMTIVDPREFELGLHG